MKDKDQIGDEAEISNFIDQNKDPLIPASRYSPETHQRNAAKVSRIPIKVESHQPIRKPDWVRIKLGNQGEINRIRALLRSQALHTVCEEAACPNLSECFSSGTATFMILGDICTRRCPFCDVAHGKPKSPDPEEPYRLAQSILQLNLKHAVITSVDRDDLRDGGATQFANCIVAIRASSPKTRIEILVPDFRGRMDPALRILSETPPDIFNHNLETIPRLYKAIRPGADYQHSLLLLKTYKEQNPTVLTKSGIMLGMGEDIEEVIEVMKDLKHHHCDMLTIGQYLQPSKEHLPVRTYIAPDIFEELKNIGLGMGFTHVASGTFVRSSYHAEQQALS